MESSRSAVTYKTRALAQLCFEDQAITSFSGLVIFQKLFDQLELKNHLRGCFRHRQVTPIFGPWRILLLLIVHLLLGYRQLRHLRYYADDPMVPRTLGVHDSLMSPLSVARCLISIRAVSTTCICSSVT